MEIRQYWNVFKRRWLLVVIPAAIVLAAGLITYQAPAPAYNVGVRFLVGQPPAAAADLEDEERLANWQASEYVVNGLTDWVRGNLFAEAVSAELARAGYDIPGGAIGGGLAADNTRSMMEISLTHGDPEALAAMIEAVITVLQSENVNAIPQLGGETAVVAPLDQPVIVPISAGIRSQLDLPLRLLVALVAGIGLALLVEYLDPTLRSREEVEGIGIPLLGEIPKK